ncbi:MAG: phosphate acyltransferase PlsX [Magnetococcales bacterium]|nr:phosphate acyltransferase PlsX [Magnetococcales bacterium]
MIEAPAPVRIALDAMGGDHAPRSVIEGAVQAAAEFPHASFVLVGLEERIRAELSAMKVDSGRFTLHPASQVVAMDEKPSVALRSKKDSSLRVGANLVREKTVDALVSAGNTGALMATAKFVLKTVPGIDRPAIASILPTQRGRTLMLDLGANVDCTPTHLLQFALMGHVYATTVLNIPKPRIGLLNIGEEEMKGNELVREAGELIRKVFLGDTVVNVEGDGIFRGEVDVVVCDGFVGNVSLKSTEGVAQLLTHSLKEEFGRSIWTKLGYLCARPVLRAFKEKFDHRRYNGAMLLGLNGVVVKSHGSADGEAFYHAIRAALRLTSHSVNDRIREEAPRLLRTQGMGAGRGEGEAS